MTTAQAQPAAAPGDVFDGADLAEVPAWLEDLADTLHTLAGRHRGPARAALMMQAARCRSRAGITRAAYDNTRAAFFAIIEPLALAAAAVVETIDERGNLNTVDRLQVDQLRDLRRLAQAGAAGLTHPKS